MLTTIIRKLPAPAEFSLVMLVCLWWAIYANVLAIARHSSPATNSAQQFTGIGVELGAKDGKVIIVQVLPNAPASKAGLSSGLVLERIDGTPAAGKEPQECRDALRGPAGSKVELEVVDPVRNETKTIELTRDSIQAPVPKLRTTNRSALRVAVIEIVGLALTFWIARLRGWPLATWGFRPSWKLTGAGVLLFLVMALTMTATALSANAISPGVVRRASISDLSMPVLLLFSMLNPLFEEAVEVGYIFQSLQRYGMWTAVLASALLRTFLHAYQGITALLMIFPLGLIFAFVYWKWRRLWPLLIAHALFDFYAFFPRN